MGLFSRVLAGGVREGELRWHPSNPAEGVLEMFDGGYDTAAGVTVTPARGLQYAAVYAAVRVLSEGVAMLPLVLYERLQPRGKQRAPGHSLYPILHDAPNPEMTAFEFRETMMGHLVLWGNAYAEIEYDRAGRVMGLWPLRPDKMKVKRKDKRLVYEYTLPNGRLAEPALQPDQVFHVRGLGSNGIVGYSPITLARQSIGLGLATEEFGSRFFGNGARPGVVLEHPGKLGDEAYGRLKTSWAGRHQGLKNAHRVAILEEGMGVKEVGIPPEDAQFLETRKFQVTEIARIYRIPPHMLADLERATFSNIEHLGIEFVTHSLGPWLKRWEQRIGLSLLTEAERQVYFAEHLVAALLRGDIKSRYEAYAVGRNWGWMSADDVRELENMNPLPNGEGGVYLQPLNMVDAGQMSALDEGESGDSLGDGEQGARWQGGKVAGGGESRDAESRIRLEQLERRAANSRHRLAGIYRRNLEDVAQRVVNREVNDVGNGARRILKAGANHDSPVQFEEWVREFYDEHLSFVNKYLGPVLASYGELVVADVEAEVGGVLEDMPGAEGRMDVFMGDYTESRSGVWVARNQARIIRAYRDAEDARITDSGIADSGSTDSSSADPLAAVEAELAAMKEKVAPQWAADQAIRANGAVTVAAFGALGVVRKRWMAFGENCPYCSNMDGVVVEVSGYFLKAEESYNPDGAPTPFVSRSNIGHPPMHTGCDCMIVAA